MTVPLEYRQGSIREQQAFEEWGCVNGKQRCFDTLKEQILYGGDKHLVLHKRIKIVDRQGNELKRLDEKVLNLGGGSLKFEERVDCFVVTLTTNLKDDSYFFKRPQPLDDLDTLVTYFKYKTAHPFSPHRYPPDFVNKTNIFLQPWVATERHITVLTG